VAIGRKNFLFVGNDVAGDHLAVLQSLIATCDLHDVNPTEYLTDVLMRIQSHPANRIGELLPHRWVDMIADTQRGAA
jgi:transposase